MTFLDRYIQTAGVTFTPPAFHRWACLSLVAAALADRVWLEKLKKHVYPNLYVMLVGPSGCGKGEALDMMMKLASDVPSLLGRILRGGLTKQRLLDILGGRSTKREKGEAVVSEAKANTSPWIIYPELYNSLGAGGPVAEAFIANLTDLYTGSPVPMTEGTRTWGDVVIEKYCMRGNVEVLTPAGWKALDRCESTETMLQWQPGGALSWTIGKLVTMEHAGVLHTWQSPLHHCSYTPEHRIPTYGGRSKQQLKVESAARVSQLKEASIPITGVLASGAENPLWLRLLLAIQADGCIQHRGRAVYFGLKKQRKIDRLFGLCAALGIPVVELKSRPTGQRLFKLRHAIVDQIKAVLGPDKHFGPWLLQLSAEGRRVFLDEIVWWDGHESRTGKGNQRNGYSSRHEENVKWVATVCHLSGKAAYIAQRPSAWYVTIRDQDRTTLCQKAHRVETYDGTVYCVEVPSSYVLVRSNGKIHVTGNCVNWTAGTTESWLKKSLSPEAILSGFFGRTVTITGTYQDEWIEAVFPQNYNDLWRLLTGQLEQICQMAGPIALSPEAQHIRVQWMRSREVPTDPFLRPMYQRDDDLFLKLCMVLAACDLSYTVTRDHALRARDLVRERWAPGAALVRVAQSKPESDQLETISSYIRQAGRMDHSTLVHKCSGRGIMAKTVNSVIDTLTQGGRVTMDVVGRKRWYQWQAGRPMAAVDVQPEVELAAAEPQAADLHPQTS